MTGSFNIAICDDSKKDADYLVECCKKTNLLPSSVYSVFSDGIDLVKDFKQKPNNNIYNIIFLDVDMPKMSGITAGEIIRNLDKNVIIVFVSSYPQFAIDAYECEAFRYLLKPYTVDQLRAILKKAIGKIDIQNQYYIVKLRQEKRRFKISDLYYVECVRKHLIYHFEDENDYIEVTDKLNNAFLSLKKYGFVQVHQGYIVNLEKIKEFSANGVVLVNKAQIPISSRRKGDVLLSYAQYVERYN